MRSYQVFASMSEAQAESLYTVLRERAPAAAAQALGAASAALKARPVYLRRLPAARQAAAMRRALARVGANVLAEEILAVYFLECRPELLREWLDCAGVEHEDGTLKEESPPQPDPAALREAVERFRKAAEGEEATAERELLLRAFCAQSSVEWPELEALLGAG